jgi:hypothetical protein
MLRVCLYAWVIYAVIPIERPLSLFYSSWAKAMSVLFLLRLCFPVVMRYAGRYTMLLSRYSVLILKVLMLARFCQHKRQANQLAKRTFKESFEVEEGLLGDRGSILLVEM